jgi:2'-5' RNA ligase
MVEAQAGLIRAFIAIPLSAAVTAALAEVAERLRGAAAQVSWVRPGNIHLTLKFLGEIGQAGVERVGAVLDEVAARHAPFTLGVGGLGVFPNPRAPRVVWAGLTAGAGEAAAIQRDLEAGLGRLGFAREARRFAPHLTLGRVRSPQNVPALLAHIGAVGEFSAGEVAVTHLDLMRSQLDPRGSIYTALRQAPLTARPSP